MCVIGAGARSHLPFPPALTPPPPSRPCSTTRHPPTSWRLQHQRFEIAPRQLGQGAYGQVCFARDHLTRQTVGIKRISPVFGPGVPFEHSKRIFRAWLAGRPAQ